MGVFVCEYGVIACALTEGLERRYLDVIADRRIERLVPAVPDGCAHGVEEPISLCDAL